MSRPRLRAVADPQSTGWVDIASSLTPDWVPTPGATGMARIKRTGDTVVCQLVISPSATNAGTQNVRQDLIVIPAGYIPAFYGSINGSMPQGTAPVTLVNTHAINRIAAQRIGGSGAWNFPIIQEFRWETTQAMPA